MLPLPLSPSLLKLLLGRPLGGGDIEAEDPQLAASLKWLLDTAAESEAARQRRRREKKIEKKRSLDEGSDDQSNNNADDNEGGAKNSNKNDDADDGADGRVEAVGALARAEAAPAEAVRRLELLARHAHVHRPPRVQLGKIVVEGYHTLQLVHFYTSGPDECRCWTIRGCRTRLRGVRPSSSTTETPRAADAVTSPGLAGCTTAQPIHTRMLASE